MSIALRIALIYYELGQYPKAIERFQKITEQNPEAEKVRYYLGVLYESIEEFEKAIEEFEKIPPHVASYRDAILHVASILRSRDEMARAIKTLEEALKKNKNILEFYEFLASLYEEQGEIGTAIEILNQGIKVFPREERFLMMQGLLYEKKQDRKRALQAMEKVLKIDPQNATALNYIGYSYAEEGVRLDEAKEMIERALTSRPGDAYIIDSLGWVHFRRREYDKALKLLKKAEKMASSEPTIFYHLGEVYSALNERALAKRYFKRALEAWNKKTQPDKKEIEEIQRRLQEIEGKKNPS